MKKVIFYLLPLLLALASPLEAQVRKVDSLVVTPPGYSILSSVNVIGYAGYWGLYKNLNNYGTWYGLYADIRLLESPKFNKEIWSVGTYASAARSGFEANLTKYSSRSQEYSAGIVVGCYSWRPRVPIYLGFNLGIKYSIDRGNSSWGGNFEAEQSDWLWVAGVNFNIIRLTSGKDQWWPRTQLQITYERPFKTEKLTIWNNQVTGNQFWNRTYLEVMARQSVWNYFLSVRHVITPKILVQYTHADGDGKDNYGIGVEVSLHKPYKDDSISLYYLFKGNSSFDRNVSVLGININITNLF